MTLNLFGGGPDTFDIYRLTDESGRVSYTASPSGTDPIVPEGTITQQMTVATPAAEINNVIADLDRSRRAAEAGR